jgi:carbamoyltransferase
MKNGVVLAAADEERMSRKKYALGADLLRSRARDLCLSSDGLQSAEVDVVVGCDLVPLPLAAPFRRRLVRIRHHLAHAYGAYFASGEDEAAILVADNGGSPIHPERGFRGEQREIETISFWHGTGREIKNLGTVSGSHVLAVETTSDYYRVGETDNSLGHLYWTLSEELGFIHQGADGQGHVTEDGKTMGLVAYGDDRFVRAVSPFLELETEGHLRLPLADGRLRSMIRALVAGANGADAEEALAIRGSVAFAGQRLLEIGLLHCAAHLREKTKAPALVMAGGVALNCVANRRIADEAGFDRVFVLPAAGDNGNALGAAVYGLLEVAGFDGELALHAQLPFLGAPAAAGEVAAALERAVASGLRVSTPSDLWTTVAELLANGAVVAWFEGRSEFGPRALGHRSILADPRERDMRRRLNEVTKRRESFRPFAPLVLAERMTDCFCLPAAARPCAAFMLTVAEVRPAWRQRLQAVMHVDGSSRIQIVDEERYPSMHRLVSRFADHTGVPVVLNTSFNRGGEPLVETPDDAVDCFLRTDVDHMVMEGKLVSRS